MGNQYLRSIFETIRDEKRSHANTATRIGEAFLALLSFLEDSPYLRKDKADSTSYILTMLAGAVIGGSEQIKLNADGSITCGSVTSSLESVFQKLRIRDVLKSEGASSGFDGTGIYMTAGEGKIEADALEVRGWMRVAKLVYNMIQVMEQDYLFSGGGDIEKVERNGDGTYTLYIHKEKEGKHVPFSDFDILYGKVDDDGEMAGADYYTSWMRVCQDGVTQSERMAPDTVRVELWEDKMVPGNRNYAPKAMMTVARRGNTQDPERQSYWELSTTDHCLVHYWHVDQPVLRADNYALAVGILPAILDDAGVLPSTRDRRKPSLYVNTIFYENAHHIYYPSYIVKVDRGQWVAGPSTVYSGMDGSYDGATYIQGQTISEPYHCENFSRNMFLIHRLSPANSSLSDEQLLQKMRNEWHVDMETSRVWHHGALWECLVEGTTEEPGISDHWTMISGQPLRIDFDFDRGTLVWVDDVHLQAEARVVVGNEDITEDILQLAAEGVVDVTWTWDRMSGKNSTQTAADELWQPVTQVGSPNILIIDHKLGDASRRTDCGPLWESQLRVRYRCTASLSTGETASGEMGLG